ncbi:GNAT family N-acetyltransferase [Shewanella schlegeliana]|uniref:GNAT family N-acetyltransferase n=1 Tax=Shewanella schlegeliana TaxID=190308 RepID=A0ABS1SUG1_9GAMM|nr:GNAT family N-acetyltransferase [Shewanella schlegeliana]MBL4912178.1 GNAT family N-acetyltransferase [Shewanella schlegeliana]MCL1110736.1 GNAT family N-acetyltransferase [Shewanella schlegeliana]GIU22734.1 spermine/spermidine acetyltransferase [Shewanella schlegeliana]
MTLVAPSLSIQTVNQSNRNALLNLQLNTEQCDFIEPIATCLEEALQDRRYTPVALCIDEQIAGFAMYGLFDESQQSRVWFDRFLIDKQFQGRGLGKAFAQLLLTFLFNHFNCQQIFLSVYPNNDKAIALYHKLGFQFTGEQDINGEHIMSLDSKKTALRL